MYTHKTYLFLCILFYSTIASCSQSDTGNNHTETVDVEVDGDGDDNNDDEVGINETKQFNFPSDTYVMVGAHRAGGFVHGLPENSLSAIKNSLELGVDIIEIDVRITADNQIVVIHDKTLDRTTNGSGKVSHHKLKEIKKLYLKDKEGNLTSEKVLTLEEVMNTIGNKALVFIDKSEFLLDYVIPILNKTNSYENALFMDFIEFDKAKAKYKNLLEKSYYVPGVHDSNTDLDTYYVGFKEGLKPNPAAFAFWFKDEKNSKSFSLIKETLDSNIPVWINTTTDTQSAGHTDAVSLINPDAGWGWVLNTGARILFTDEPKELIEYLSAKGLR